MRQRPAAHENRRTDQSVPSYDRIAGSALQLANERRDAEMSLAGAVLADPALLIPVASRAGVRREHLHDEDILLIYDAAWRRWRRERRYVLRRAMLALMVAGYWSPDQVPANLGQMLWSCSSLIALANSWFPSPAIVIYYARRVIDLAEQALAAQKQYDDLIRSLTIPQISSPMQLRRAA